MTVVTRTGAKGIALIQQFEGLHKVRADGKVEAYPDPATGGKPWTIGWGTTGADVKPGTVWTKAQCDTRLVDDLRRFEESVAALTVDTTTQDQFDALVSFAYNCGPANLKSSTLLRMHNSGDHAAAALQFGRWNKAAGKVMKGLTRRREAERRLYAGEVG